MSLLALSILGVFVLLPSVLGQYAPYVLLIVVGANILRPSTLMTVRHRRPSPMVPMFLAGFVIMAATTLAPGLGADDGEHVFNFAALVLAVPVLWRVQRDARPQGMAVIARTALAGATLCVAVAVVEVLVFGMQRAGDIAFNPIQFGDLSVLIGFLALAGSFAPDQPRGWRLAYVAGPVLGILAAYLSGTRGAIVAVLPLSVLALATALHHSAARTRYALLVAAGAFLGGGTVLLTFASSRFASLSNAVVIALTTWHSADKSINTRLEFWRAGARAFLDSPIWGHGWSHMVEAALPYMPRARQVHALSFGHLHNDLVNFAVSAGVLGLVAYALILLAPVLGAVHGKHDRQRRARIYAASVLCIGYAAFGLTNVTIGYGYTTSLFAMLAALIVALGRDEAPPPATHPAASSVPSEDGAEDKEA